MKRSMQPLGFWRRCSGALLIGTTLSLSSSAQPPSRDPVANNASGSNTPTGRIELENGGATESLVETLRKEWTTAIIHGVPPKTIERLIDRRRQVDQKLAATLSKTRQQLAEIQTERFDPGQASVIAKLRRDRSLAWLNRIELSSLQSEYFAAGTPDAVAAAQQTIALIDNAVVDLSTNSVIEGEVQRLRVEAHLQAGDGWQADQAMASMVDVIDAAAISPEPLALSIRVDLANRRHDQAESKLRSFYRNDPRAAPTSASMDLAMLEFLWASSPDDETRLGNWLDTIEQRSGGLARQRGESLITRKRLIRSNDQVVPSDPRLLRADGRYYYRVDSPLQAAIAYARAAVRDDQVDRAAESAVSSAAILRKLSKPNAAIELLMQVAERYPSQPQSADLILQAATLSAESGEGAPSEIQRILNRCLDRWPNSTAAMTARDWLIDLSIQESDLVTAAKLATQVPPSQFDADAAQRCEVRWQRAVVESDDHERVLTTMIQELDQATMSANLAILHSMRSSLMILLGDSTDELSQLATQTDDEFIHKLAAFRASPTDVNEPSMDLIEQRDPALHATLRWRLQRDAHQRPESAAAIATFLLKHYSANDLATLQWLIQSGQIDRATRLMRSQSVSGSSNAIWLQTMAGALVESYATASQRPSRWKLASRLWDELADGLPENDPVGISARVQAIQYRYQSGDRDAASAQAQLMLLTQPPADSKWLRILTEIAP